MDKQEYRYQLKQMFLKYGMNANILTNEEIEYCIDNNATVDQAYSIACDLYCNDEMGFLESFSYNV